MRNCWQTRHIILSCISCNSDKRIVTILEQAWLEQTWVAYCLWPLSLLYRLVITLRKLAYRYRLLSTTPVSLPVVVIGNITVGGTGKSPLTSHFVKHFAACGWRPAIVSRGYGGQKQDKPCLLSAHSTAAEVGDEPLMLSRITGVPVCVCIERAAAVNHIAATTDANIVFADDGLQHLAMPRAAEVVVLDGKRGLGNGWLLPAGPLRESAKRLATVDVLAVQGDDALHASLDALAQTQHPAGNMAVSLNNRFSLQLGDVIRIKDDKRIPLSSFLDSDVIALAGIGYPQRFFEALTQKGMNVKGIPKPDHHQYTAEDIVFDTSIPVLVTSKDAVKLKALSRLGDNVFEVTASVVPSHALQLSIDNLEASLRSRYPHESPLKASR